MQIHQLKSKNVSKQKRVGRGGKRGAFSGHGTKGQKSRAGHKIRPDVRDLIIRLPKLKGFKNKPLFDNPVAVNLLDIEKRMKENFITLESLIKNGLIRKSEKNVKILSKGDISKAFNFKGLKVSQKAKEKIEKAGGKVE
ncbi:MAG: 50S ribosomal protein L15 [Patescibacteria group bacterium]|nr:50S ribosomal protein L15 [Patescibacteria group bacterium]